MCVCIYICGRLRSGTVLEFLVPRLFSGLSVSVKSRTKIFHDVPCCQKLLSVCVLCNRPRCASHAEMFHDVSCFQ